jgi:hypothetical protein
MLAELAHELDASLRAQRCDARLEAISVDAIDLGSAVQIEARGGGALSAGAYVQRSAPALVAARKCA